MLPLWKIIIGVITVVCAMMTAIYSDRMARELRNTGEARYENPRVIPGGPYRQNDLLVNHRQRFPQSPTRRMYKIFGSLLYGSIVAIMVSLVVQQHYARMKQLQPLTSTYETNG